MARRPSVLLEIAHRAASHPNIETAITEAVREALPGVIEAIMREICAGERLRLYVPKTPIADRRERVERIEAAIGAGESAEHITRRENISKRHLRRIRARLGGT
jgi:hypothetical protein